MFWQLFLVYVLSMKKKKTIHVFSQNIASVPSDYTLKYRFRKFRVVQKSIADEVDHEQPTYSTSPFSTLKTGPNTI